MNKYILIRNLTTLFILGSMLYWFFPFPPIVWRVGLVLLSLYVIVIENRHKTKIEKAILLFAFFNLIHFFVSYLWITPSTTQIGNILCALLPISLFICLGEKGVMTDKFLTTIGILLLIAAVFGFYHGEAMLIELKNLSNDTDITNNLSVTFLLLLPMLFLYKKNWLIVLTIVVSFYFSIAGAKRGNIIAAIIPIALFVWYMLRNSRHSIGKTFLVVVAFILVGYFAYDWFSTNDYLMHRLEETAEGNTSGREVIYANAWRVWYDSYSFVHYLFGYGFDGTIHHPLLHGTYAHNDWLEILVDYGLLGIVMYLAIFLALFRIAIRTENLELKLTLLSVFFIWVMKTIYSMGFTEYYMSLIMISMGTAIGKIKSSQLTIPSNKIQ